MRQSWTASAAALIRVRNLLIAAAGVAIGGALALGRPALPPALVAAVLSALGLGAAGNVANDFFDVEADRVNKPRRPLVTGAVSRRAALLLAGVAGGLGLASAWWAGPVVFGMGVAALALMLAYSPVLKSRGLAGNVTVAVVGSLPLVYGAAAAGDWRAGLVPFVLAAPLHLGRELVKDVEDVRGDLALGRRTLPIVWGLEAGFLAAAAALVLFIPLALLPWIAGWYGARYGLVAIAIDLFVIVLIVRLAGQRPAGARAALKLAMTAGLVALLWDRL